MALLNSNAIAELREAIGDEAVHDIAQALRQTLHEFRDERPHLDSVDLGRRAHSLKGSTSYLGTEDLHAAAIAADQAHKQGGDTGAALDQLIALIDPSLAALDAYLSST